MPVEGEYLGLLPLRFAFEATSTITEIADHRGYAPGAEYHNCPSFPQRGRQGADMSARAPMGFRLLQRLLRGLTKKEHSKRSLETQV